MANTAVKIWLWQSHSSQWIVQKLAANHRIVDVRVAGRLRNNSGDVLRDWALNGAGIALEGAV